MHTICSTFPMCSMPPFPSPSLETTLELPEIAKARGPSYRERRSSSQGSSIRAKPIAEGLSDVMLSLKAGKVSCTKLDQDQLDELLMFLSAAGPRWSGLLYLLG